MPAIDVAQIRIEAAQLLHFYNEPESFAKEVREFFRAHSDPLFRRSDTVSLHAPIESYGAPPMVMRTLVGGLRKIAKEYPQYTRPEIFAPKIQNSKFKIQNSSKAWVVPKVLLSGDHNKINGWRKENSK